MPDCTTSFLQQIQKQQLMLFQAQQLQTCIIKAIPSKSQIKYYSTPTIQISALLRQPRIDSHSSNRDFTMVHHEILIIPPNVVEWNQKKKFQIAGKGHNVIFEIAIPMKHTNAATNSVDGHVPENGGTCQFTKLCRSSEECVNGLHLMSKVGRIN